MPPELQWLASLGVGGILAGGMFLAYRQDRKDSRQAVIDSAMAAQELAAEREKRYLSDRDSFRAEAQRREERLSIMADRATNSQEAHVRVLAELVTLLHRLNGHGTGARTRAEDPR